MLQVAKYGKLSCMNQILIFYMLLLWFLLVSPSIDTATCSNGTETDQPGVDLIKKFSLQAKNFAVFCC